MPTLLFFDLPGALALAEHAAAAPGHEPSLTELDEARDCLGALVWTSDDGTYLSSSGLPALLRDPGDPSSHLAVVYAEGWDPGQPGGAPLAGDTDLGDDDFSEHLHLHEHLAGPGSPTLLQHLRAADSAGFGYFVLEVTPGHVTTRVTRHRAGDQQAAPPAAAAAPAAPQITQGDASDE